MLKAPKMRWRSVEKDGQPKRDGAFIVTESDGEQSFSTWNYYHLSHGWCNDGMKVTHWMPFPEPAEAGGQKEQQK